MVSETSKLKSIATAITAASTGPQSSPPNTAPPRPARPFREPSHLLITHACPSTSTISPSAIICPRCTTLHQYQARPISTIRMLMSDTDKASVSQRYCSLEPQLQLGKGAFARASGASQDADSLQPVSFSIKLC